MHEYPLAAKFGNLHEDTFAITIHTDWSKIQDAKNLFKLHFTKKGIYTILYIFYRHIVMFLTCNKTILTITRYSWHW